MLSTPRAPRINEFSQRTRLAVAFFSWFGSFACLFFRGLVSRFRRDGAFFFVVGSETSIGATLGAARGVFLACRDGVAFGRISAFFFRQGEK